MAHHDEFYTDEGRAKKAYNDIKDIINGTINQQVTETGKEAQATQQNAG
jgi:hypothetical protein